MSESLDRPIDVPELTAEEILARVLHRDGLMLIIDKPAGLPVHRGPKGGANLEASFDALRFDVKPIETPFEEYLRYAIQPEGSSAAVVTLAWERRAVTFRIDAQP